MLKKEDAGQVENWIWTIALAAVLGILLVFGGLWLFAAPRLDYCSFEREGQGSVRVILHRSWGRSSTYEGRGAAAGGGGRGGRPESPWDEAYSFAEAIEYASRLCPNFKEMPR